MTAAFTLSPSIDRAGLSDPVRVTSLLVEGRLHHDELSELLLARANDGDGAAFAQFLHAVTPTLRAVIRRRGEGLPPDQHEDVLQRCFWRSISNA